MRGGFLWLCDNDAIYPLELNQPAPLCHKQFLQHGTDYDGMYCIQKVTVSLTYSEAM